MRRAEDETYDDGTTTLAVGTVHSSGAREAPEHPAAVLWVPDIEQQHGWREFYVYPKREPPRRVGYRR